MTQHTSRTAYQELLASGKLRGQQARVLARLVATPRQTSGEILFAMNIRNVNAWRARFTELQARGLIREVAQRKCEVSGRLSLVWEYSGRAQPLALKNGHRVAGRPIRKRVRILGGLS